MARDGTAPVALVTGAARGIGLEVARQLRDAGFDVLLTARDGDRARATAEPLGARALALDVADPASISAAAAAVRADPGRLDVLVNNAAGFAPWDETAIDADLGAAHALLATNVIGPWRVVQAFLPLLRESRRARIVNVASGAGSHGDTVFGLAVPRSGAPSYAVSKAALGALTSKLALELDGMLVNAVCPGLTATAPGMEAMGARPVPEGAASVVWAALLPADGPTGGFFRDGERLSW
jgi:NAD(P)-dependent dehydrogenase (short-subunit alcohol dehydrogenase family)